MKTKITFSILFLLLSASSGLSEQKKLPLNPFRINDQLIGKEAPALVIAEWLNGDGVTLQNLKGKVVILEFFQMWCPGCNEFSIPLMEEWKEKYKNEDKIFFLSIHTVFEGHEVQSPARLKKFVKKKNIDHLIGIDAHLDANRVPETMKIFRTGGTPAMAIIDKNGVIRFKYFGGFRKEPVETLIDYLLVEE
jgi:thiol-disulfide isomerase/thioredoxin